MYLKNVFPVDGGYGFSILKDGVEILNQPFDPDTLMPIDEQTANQLADNAYAQYSQSINVISSEPTQPPSIEERLSSIEDAFLISIGL